MQLNSRLSYILLGAAVEWTFSLCALLYALLTLRLINISVINLLWHMASLHPPSQPTIQLESSPGASFSLQSTELQEAKLQSVQSHNSHVVLVSFFFVCLFLSIFPSFFLSSCPPSWCQEFGAIINIQHNSSECTSVGYKTALLILKSISHILSISMIGVDKVPCHYAHSWGWIIVQLSFLLGWWRWWWQSSDDWLRCLSAKPSFYQ